MATWTNSGYNAAPASNDSPTLGDDGIRSTRAEVYWRADNEHTTYENTSSDGTRKQDWLHKLGSAKAYRQAAAPTTRPNTSSLTSDDEGRMWFDSDADDLAYVYDGSSWTGFIREITRFNIQGTLSTGTDLVPAMIFPRDCHVTKVSARAGTAPTGANLNMDINKNATTSIFSSTFAITTGANATSTTTFDTSAYALSADDYLTFDIDQVGSSTAGADLSVVVEVVLR